MGRKVSVIEVNHVEEARKDLKALGCKGVVARRLQAIISCYKNGIKKVSEVLDLNRSTLNNWMNDYKRYGIEGLMNDCKPSRSKLKEEHILALKRWIEEKPTYTIKELVNKFAMELELSIGKSSVHRALIKLGFSHITGRKKHYKSDEEVQESFKKN